MTVISHKAMTMRSLSLELIVFSRPRVSGSTSGKNLGGCATLGFSPWLIPPHSVAKHYTNSLRSCIVTIPGVKYCWTTLYSLPIYPAEEITWAQNVKPHQKLFFDASLQPAKPTCVRISLARCRSVKSRSYEQNWAWTRNKFVSFRFIGDPYSFS